ncbi:ABC transporter permease [Halomonas nitroreducens]|uniref:ABC transporter permease n=1 Tax=Halomonas nitroreducens TaxID=447425 RepID=A0A3S0K2W7_9GAMM|nr:ABC transporter permease [Halomonas nitroreducens]RTR02974.1 ABC transporter permease [Halomonas nitroreducens]
MTTAQLSQGVSEPPLDAHHVAGGESYPTLVWRRFRRNKLALIGLAMLILLVTVAVFAPFFAPMDPTARSSDHSYGPPQTLNWYSEEGGFSLRPFVHPLEESYDPVTYQPILEENTSERIYVEFFAAGWEYRWLGIPLETHLFQLEDGSPLYLMGSDALGRDLFSRILFGARLTLLLGVLVVALSVTVGTLVGITSGYFGGRKDNLIQRVTELFLAFPELPLFLALIAILPQAAQPSTLFLLMVAILSVLKWAQLAREVRGKALSLAQLDYVKAAIACGASDRRIILRHILPNVMSHVIVASTILIPNVILAESFLSFLGVGIQAPLISLGQLLNAAADFQAVGAYPWLLSPVLFILLAVLAFNAIGDGLRDAIDPYGNA